MKVFLGNALMSYLDQHKHSCQWIGWDQLQFLERLLRAKHGMYLDQNQRSFSLQAQAEGNTIIAVLTLRNLDQSFVYPVYAKVDDWKNDFESEIDAFYFLVDYIDIYFEEFFESEDTLFLPINWAKHSYVAIDVWVKGQIINLKVERLGDELLERAKDSHISVSQPSFSI